MTRFISTIALISFALTTAACSTTGMSSGYGVKNEGLIEAGERIVNTEAGVIENFNAAEAAVFNCVVYQGQLADMGNMAFDPLAQYKDCNEKLGNKLAQITEPMKVVLESRFQQVNTKRYWNLN